MSFLQEFFSTGISGNAVSDLLGSDASLDSSLLSGIIGKVVLYVVLFMLLSFALYIYLSLAYSKIGSKAKLTNPGVAWMPSLGKLAVIFESSKMHWWPFLMLVLGFTLGYSLMIFVSGIGMLILISAMLIVTMLIFMIMAIIWHWKTYEAIGKPGWWILVPVISNVVGTVLAILGLLLAESKTIPIIGLVIIILGVVAHLVLVGIAAWSGGSEGETNLASIHEVPKHSQ